MSASRLTTTVAILLSAAALAACGTKEETTSAETSITDTTEVVQDAAPMTDTTPAMSDSDAAPAQIAELATYAATVSRELRSLAAQMRAMTGASSEYDYRSAELFSQMAGVGDFNRGVVVTVRGANGSPVVLWDGEKAVAITAADLAPVIEQVQYSRDGASACVTYPVESAFVESEIPVAGGECAW